MHNQKIKSGSPEQESQSSLQNEHDKSVGQNHNPFEKVHQGKAEMPEDDALTEQQKKDAMTERD